MTREEKLKYVKALNWDYTTPAEDMLDVIEGKCEEAGPFNEYNLFARSFLGFKWQEVIKLWGLDRIRKLMEKDNDRLRRNVIPVMRSEYDYISALLLGKPIPLSRRNYSNSEWKNRPVLSDRWNRIIKGIS